MNDHPSHPKAFKPVEYVTFFLSTAAIAISIVSIVHSIRNDRITNQLNRPILTIEKGKLYLSLKRI